jgi:hypothetical protein
VCCVVFALLFRARQRTNRCTRLGGRYARPESGELSSWPRKLTLFVSSKLQLFIAVIALTGGSAWAQSALKDVPKTLTIDMPYGACRVTVLEDGSAMLFYGALPQHVRVKNGTFNVDDLNASIRNHLRVEADRLKLVPPVGSVRLGSQAETLWFNDEAFAKSIFHKAWVNRLRGVQLVQRQDEKLLSRFCAIQE